MLGTTWKAVFSVGIKELDAQHKRLFDFMNEVYERLETRVDTGDYSDFFESLNRHAEIHFSTEERYFVAYKYRNLTHLKEHAKIKRKIRALEERYNEHPSPTVVFETLRLLDDWLFEHIARWDKKYMAHFKEHGLF